MGCRADPGRVAEARHDGREAYRAAVHAAGTGSKPPRTDLVNLPAESCQRYLGLRFPQTHDVFFRPLFAFIVTELGSRRIVHLGVTRSPTDEWVAQQLREATPFGVAPRYLIRDNDAKYGPPFEAVATGTGIKVLRTPVKAPRANAICERLLGSVRRECLDHILILSEGHLRRVLSEYALYFNRARPHQGIGQRRLEAERDRSGGEQGEVVASPVLGGLHHDYRRAVRPKWAC